MNVIIENIDQVIAAIAATISVAVAITGITGAFRAGVLKRIRLALFYAGVGNDFEVSADKIVSAKQ